MLVGQECYNEHTLTAEENAAALMALRSAFRLPVMLAFFLAVFDLYHVYTQTNWSCIGDAGARASLVGFALLRAINSYFPSTLLPYAMVVGPPAGHLPRLRRGCLMDAGRPDVLVGGIFRVVRRIHCSGRDGAGAVRGNDGGYRCLWVKYMAFPG